MRTSSATAMAAQPNGIERANPNSFSAALTAADPVNAVNQFPEAQSASTSRAAIQNGQDIGGSSSHGTRGQEIQAAIRHTSQQPVPRCATCACRETAPGATNSARPQVISARMF
jgi:hypothetical protein